MGTAEASQAHLGKREVATLHAIALQVSKPDRVRNAAAYATRIEDVAPAAPVDLGR
jgi:hypothetical protein